ncbi:hypothetical protein DY000_02020632 [Brassica cretica]|uniref:Uncharacterized protein n=1 Tax=Brassica cretica TaxID=69181 RepID=A0ABQ7DZJ6_BRACR|nr:hypothetical protein DY000_02020632 [Brassica cretica]
MFAVLRLDHHCGSVGSVLGSAARLGYSRELGFLGRGCSWACSGVTLRGSGLRERFFDHASCFSFRSFRFWGCPALKTVSSRHPLSLPPHNIITPACLASELIYPPSAPQASLAPAAPFLRLLLVVFDWLRKLMPAIIFREPKTVTMTLFCSAYLNIPYLSQVCTLVSRSPTSVGILSSYVVHIIIKRKPLITSVGYYQPFPNPLDRAPHFRFIFRLQYVLGNISFRVSSEASLWTSTTNAAPQRLQRVKLSVSQAVVAPSLTTLLVMFSSSLTTVSSRHPLSLPPHNIITPACLASELIYPPSLPQATLAPAAPFLHLLLVVFDCLRKLMPAIIFREPKTVTMTLFCSAYLNIPYLSQVCTLVSRSPTSVGILCSYVVHIIIKRKPLITSVGYYQPFPNPLDRAPHCRFIFRLQYVLGNISFRVSSEASLWVSSIF